MLAWEFWRLKPTCLNVAELEEHGVMFLTNTTNVARDVKSTHNNSFSFAVWREKSWDLDQLTFTVGHLWISWRGSSDQLKRQIWVRLFGAVKKNTSFLSQWKSWILSALWSDPDQETDFTRRLELNFIKTGSSHRISQVSLDFSSPPSYSPGS